MADNFAAVIDVERAGLTDRSAALKLLYQQLPASDRARQVTSWCDAASRGDVSLQELWIARRNGNLIAVLLQLFQPGKVCFTWPPVIADGIAQDIADKAAFSLLKAATASADAAGMEYSQVVLETVELEPLQRLIRHDYHPLTELLFQERLLSGVLPACDWSALTLEPFSVEKSARLAKLLERTFEGTRDCPEVSSRRSGSDALDRHLGAGSAATRHWVFARERQGGELGDVGVLLLLDHQTSGIWEIDYFGIVPEARGRGLGKRLIQWGLHAAHERGAERMQAVVDSKNRYACDIYDETGFQVQQRRQALVRLRPDDALPLG